MLAFAGSAQTLGTFKVTSSKRTTGKKVYAHTDHLGSVHATVSDARVAQINGPTILSFAPRVEGATSTYAFGSKMPGSNQASNYRYGFNGMEQDDEVSGDGNSYTTDFRLYDPRVGRWLSTDPVRHHNWSPYNAFDDNPIALADPSGADADGGWDDLFEMQYKSEGYKGSGMYRVRVGRKYYPDRDYNRALSVNKDLNHGPATITHKGQKYSYTWMSPEFYAQAPSQDLSWQDVEDDWKAWVWKSGDARNDTWAHRLDYSWEHEPEMKNFFEAMGHRANVGGAKRIRPKVAAQKKQVSSQRKKGTQTSKSSKPATAIKHSAKPSSGGVAKAASGQAYKHADFPDGQTFYVVGQNHKRVQEFASKYPNVKVLPIRLGATYQLTWKSNSGELRKIKGFPVINIGRTGQPGGNYHRAEGNILEQFWDTVQSAGEHVIHPPKGN